MMKFARIDLSHLKEKRRKLFILRVDYKQGVSKKFKRFFVTKKFTHFLPKFVRG